MHESIYEELGQEMADIVSQLKVGNGLEDGVDLGPLQNPNQLDIVNRLVEQVKETGARILCGGVPLDGEVFLQAYGDS